MMISANCLRSTTVCTHADITDAVSTKINERSREGSLSWQRSLQEAADCSVVIGGSLMPDHEFDGRLAIAARLTADLRASVERELNYTVSAGISHNKILSKIASAMNKPNNQTVVPVHAVAEVMNSLPLKKIRNFGGGIGRKLEALGCSTAADVQGLSLSTLQEEFGSCAAWVARSARGISDEPVKAKSIPKSMLAAKSFGATSDWQVLLHWLKVLCCELASRIKEDSNVHCRRPKNLVVHYRSSGGKGRYGAGQERSRSAHLPSRGLPSSGDLVAIALKVLKSSPDVMPCNRVAVSTNMFTPMGTKAGSLASMFSPKGKPRLSMPMEHSGLTQRCGEPHVHAAGVGAHTSVVCKVGVPDDVETGPACTSNLAAFEGSMGGEPVASRLHGKRTLLQLMQEGVVDACGGCKVEGKRTFIQPGGACESSVHLTCTARVTHVGCREDPVPIIPCEDVHGVAAEWGGSNKRQVPQRRSAWSEPVTLRVKDPTHACQAEAVSCGWPTDPHAVSADHYESNSGHRPHESSAAIAWGKESRDCAMLPVGSDGNGDVGKVANSALTTRPTQDATQGVDVAEQRRIYHLIQMEARDHKQIGRAPSLMRPVGKSGQTLGQKHVPKQASILSLLHKK
eukprot:jgi/Ulvmu1/4959/UM207_0003.1